MQGEDIRFPSNGQEGMGFLARPDGDTPVPGVVVISGMVGTGRPHPRHSQTLCRCRICRPCA